MIESYLINAGLGCGTVMNFDKEILKSLTLNTSPRWYFRTPIKVVGNGLKTAVINMSFPFRALPDEVSEIAVLSRLELTRKDYENDLIYFLRKNKFIVPPDAQTFYLIPFWSDSVSERKELKGFAEIGKIHLLTGNITVKYRNLELPTSIDPVLFALQNEQSLLEKKIDTLTIYVAGAEFAALDQVDQDLITDQLAAMNTYNDRLKTRILNY